MPYSDPADQRAAEKRWRDKHQASLSDKRRRKLERMKAWIKERKSVPCVDCGNEYPYYVMDFDHRPDEVKVADVNRLVQSRNWARVMVEVEKCDVVCSNCHRERSHQRSIGM